MARDIEFEQKIAVGVALYAGGDAVAAPRQDDATIEYAAGPDLGAPYAALRVNLDLGLAAQGIGIDLDLAALTRFARQVMHPAVQVGEIVWDLSAREKVIIAERLDDTTVLVTGPGGQYRLNIGDIARPRTIADPEMPASTNGDGAEAAGEA